MFSLGSLNEDNSTEGGVISPHGPRLLVLRKTEVLLSTSSVKIPASPVHQVHISGGSSSSTDDLLDWEGDK